MPPPLRRPPEDLDPARVALLAWEEPLYRIQDDALLVRKTYPTARHRYDSPSGEYPITYCNDSRIGVFPEVYVDQARRMKSEDAPRHLLESSPRRPLALLDLPSVATLSVLRLDERISTGDDYEDRQLWAQALYEAMPVVQGLRYGARCAGRSTSNVALFADRCGGAGGLAATDLGRLADLETIVLTATDRYDLSADFVV